MDHISSFLDFLGNGVSLLVGDVISAMPIVFAQWLRPLPALALSPFFDFLSHSFICLGQLDTTCVREPGSHQDTLATKCLEPIQHARCIVAPHAQ